MTGHTQFTEIDEAAIRTLVETFYARVMEDPDLSRPFERTIGPVGAPAWREHFDTLSDFWSSVMLKTGRYHGNPMGKHARVEGIKPGLFQIWLRLFDRTAAELFVEPIAAEFSSRAHRIAQSLQLGLFFRPERPAGNRQTPAG